MQAALRRLLDLQIITDSYHQSLVRFWSAQGYRKAEPQPLKGEASYRMRQLGYRALAEGIVTPSRAAELLGDSLHRVEQYWQDRTARARMPTQVLISDTIIRVLGIRFCILHLRLSLIAKYRIL
ncbi:hypothetical protein QQM79_02370 [Marinobacteraceae bacterium S3BR75-40.1]